MHIDVDVYEPTKLILEKLWDKITPGGILMLDDYETIEGETIAVDKFFTGKELKINNPMFNNIPKYVIKADKSD